MNLQNVVPVGQNDYVIETSKDLVALSSIARIGSRVLCLEDNKVYVYMDVNKWETALDLAGGPSNATYWVGVTTTALTDGATTDPVVINGENVAAELGAMVSYGPDEFVWNGSAWQKFGGDSETFRVTVDNSNRVDRTFADTFAAFNAGKFVYAVKGSELYLVDYGNNNLIAFYKFRANNVTFSSSPGAVNRVQQGFILQSDDTIVEQNEFVLPQITTSDNGKLLGVDNGRWTKIDPPSGLPSVTGSDNGKVLKVNSGTWAASNEDTLVVHYTYDSSTQTYSSDYTYQQIQQFSGPVIGQWSDMDTTGIGFANYNFLLRIIQYKCYIPSFGQYFILTHKFDDTIGTKYESASDFFVVDYGFDASNQQWTCKTPLEDFLAAYQQNRNIIAKIDDDGIIFWLNNIDFRIDIDNGTSTIIFSSVAFGNVDGPHISGNYLYHVINLAQRSTIRINYSTKSEIITTNLQINGSDNTPLLNGTIDASIELASSPNGTFYVSGGHNEIINGLALIPITYDNGGALFSQSMTQVITALASEDRCHLKIANPAYYNVLMLFASVFRQYGVSIGFRIYTAANSNNVNVFLVPIGGSESSISFSCYGPISTLGQDTFVKAIMTITSDCVMYIDAEKIYSYTDLGGQTISQLTSEIRQEFEALTYADYVAMATGNSYTIGNYIWACMQDETNYMRFEGTAQGVSYNVNVTLDSENEAVYLVDVFFMD